ncbi:MAG: FAD-linked oxidase C-terminal domain-containing protein [Desulfobacterales bacterium]|jgi:glycolate oxidase subunit GlcD
MPSFNRIKMITDEFIQKLQRIVGKEQVLISQADAELYSYDASLAKGKPSVVVFPGDSHEAAQVVQAARTAGVTFVPRGFGTNLSGGTVLPAGGLVVCLSRLNRILGMYPESRYAVVQPGVTNLELQNALAPLGFFYAPDPASQKVATIGGNTGENSGGPRCLKYGVTTNHVLGMEVILSDGERVRIGGAALDPAGYDLRGVMVGSEGTLGIVTELTVRILPLAESIITMLAIYDAISDAARSVSDIIAAGIVPTTLEMMDAAIIKAVEDSYACGYPRDAAAVLIIEVEGPTAGLKDQALRIQDICMQNQCRDIQEAKNTDERNRLWEGRRGAFGAVARLAPNYLVNDCTVPRTKLPEALEKVAEITQKYGFEHGNVFHAGDGNLHPLVLFDSRDSHQLRQVEKAGWEIMQACVNLGGTISGEHGIGMEKQDAMRMIFTEDDFNTQRALKKAFDPDNILNPGKVIPKPLSPDQNQEDDEQRIVKLPLAKSANENAINDIIDKIHTATAEKKAILPIGGGTHRYFGNLPKQPALELASIPIGAVVEYDPPNQVITVGAGMPLERLQEHLQKNNQWLPLRPPFYGKRSTIGSLVGLGVCGPERMVYGAPRDLLLGLRFINSAGQLISAGGRVVKNVAGYDITRLMTGSAGTLGYIIEATWRVATMPERCAAITATGSLNDCSAMAVEIIKSDLSPVFVTSIPEQHPAEKALQNGWRIVVGFEGFSDTVEYQLEKCGTRLEEQALTALNQTDYPVHQGVFVNHYEQLSQAPFLLRADLPLNKVCGFQKSLNNQVALSSIFLDFGCGRILSGIEDLTDKTWKLICDQAAQNDARVLLDRAPDDFRASNDVFGFPRPEWRIIHQIKTALDPDNIFSPGCLPGKV